ncbi:MAG: hypothetical protein ACK54C_11275, partial [Betaproteobacteria bacterium]
QVAVATEQFERRSITGLELLRSRGNCPENRANTRSALFGSNDNCGFWADVKSGENRGTRLGNDFVARAWSGPLRAPGDIAVSLELPKDAPLGSLALGGIRAGWRGCAASLALAAR